MRKLVACCFALLLASCGGGGSGEEENKDPVSAITIDGIKDDAWSSEAVYHAADASDDGLADAGKATDLAELYVLSDESYLYLALEFYDLSNFWNEDFIVLMLDKDGATDGTSPFTGSDAWLNAGANMSFANGKAYVYFYHKPGDGSGAGGSVLYVAGTKAAEGWKGAQSKVAVAPYGWSHPDTGDFTPPSKFIEYRFLLKDLGLAVMDRVRIYAVAVNNWGNGDTHAADIVPGNTPPADNTAPLFDFYYALPCVIGAKTAEPFEPPEPGPEVPAASLAIRTSTENSIKLSWTAAPGTDNTYIVYHSATETGPYTQVATYLNTTSYNNTGLTAGTTYWYKVSAMNPEGREGPTTSPKIGKTAAAGMTYANIDMLEANKGVLDTDFTSATLATSDTTSWDLAGWQEANINHDIKGLYVTNDANNLYIAVDFGDTVPAAYEKERVTIFVDTGTTGSATWDTWRSAATTVSPTSVNAYLYDFTDNWNMDNTTATNASASWEWQEESLYKASGTALKYAIPLTELGSATTVSVFAAFSSYWWDDADHIQVKDLIPSAAGTTTSDNESLTIDFSKALAWTLR
jgi:hypothetical protein